MARDNFALDKGGVKYDAHKLRFDLFPWDAWTEVAYVYTYGAVKYSDRNWEKGMRWGRYIGAAIRHFVSWLGGESRDPESGCHHLAQVVFCVTCLMAYELRGLGTDDRSRFVVQVSIFPDYLKAIDEAKRSGKSIPRWDEFYRGR